MSERMPKGTEDYDWVCGKCGNVVAYIDVPPSKCPECNWIHGSRKLRQIPKGLKFRLR